MVQRVVEKMLELERKIGHAEESIAIEAKIVDLKVGFVILCALYRDT